MGFDYAVNRECRWPWDHASHHALGCLTQLAFPRGLDAAFVDKSLTKVQPNVCGLVDTFLTH
jgi:hypothetical protein